MSENDTHTFILKKTPKRLFSEKIPYNRIRIDISAVRPNILTILAPLESDCQHSLRNGSNFMIASRVCISRIQRCGTYIN